MEAENLVNNIIEKSQEAFLLAIEIYNKPTIKYRVEGFNFFMCNAWELMLKAYFIKKNGKDAIYYPVKKGVPSRTISLSDCIKKVFTNDKDPLRINLEQLIVLRDTSTHFIIPEYEKIYTSLFQACLLNYIRKLNDFFEINIKEKINTTMLNIFIDDRDVTELELVKKYDNSIVKRFNKNSNQIFKIIDSNPNDKFAQTINYNYAIVKNPSNADGTFRITENAEDAVMFIDRPKNANLTHPYNGKRFIQSLNDLLKENNIDVKIGYSELKMICKKYDFYSNPNYCYKIETDATPRYTFSENLKQTIFKLIKKNPQLIEELKTKKVNLRSKGILNI